MIIIVDGKGIYDRRYLKAFGEIACILSAVLYTDSEYLLPFACI